jgi:hypothetical protein
VVFNLILLDMLPKHESISTTNIAQTSPVINTFFQTAMASQFGIFLARESSLAFMASSI